jgi:hypothetical protein
MLECDEHGVFPILNGTPSFVASSLDFEKHWKENTLASVGDQKLRKAQEFLSVFFDRVSPGTNTIVLDAGCGDGIHAKLVSEHPSCKAVKYTGIDVSLQGIETAKARGNKDCVFSFGVLAYTSDPARSFRELHRVTKPGGLIGIWVLPRQSPLLHACLSLLRLLCRITGKRGTSCIADSIVPLLSLIPTQSGISLQNASWRECREVILVDIAPRQLAFPSSNQIRCWFSDLHIKTIHDDKDCPVTLWGTKQTGSG